MPTHVGRVRTAVGAHARPQGQGARGRDRLRGRCSSIRCSARCSPASTATGPFGGGTARRRVAFVPDRRIRQVVRQGGRHRHRRPGLHSLLAQQEAHAPDAGISAGDGGEQGRLPQSRMNRLLTNPPHNLRRKHNAVHQILTVRAWRSPQFDGKRRGTVDQHAGAPPQ